MNIMQKKSGLFVLSLLLLSLSGGGAFALGDPPYRLNMGDEADVANGCLRWNWQQHAWYDYCATPVYPWAYMYPRSRSSNVVLRTRG
jgi:hypothetical protein